MGPQILPLCRVAGRRQEHLSRSSHRRGEPHWELHVASLMIRCPNTGQAISTGIETDEYSLTQIADVPARTRCPICGLDHTWWKREAWLQLQQPLLQSSRRPSPKAQPLRRGEPAAGY